MSEQNPARSAGTEQKLIELSRLTDEAVFQQYRTGMDGLNQVEAVERLEQFEQKNLDFATTYQKLQQIQSDYESDRISRAAEDDGIQVKIYNLDILQKKDNISPPGNG